MSWVCGLMVEQVEYLSCSDGRVVVRPVIGDSGITMHVIFPMLSTVAAHPGRCWSPWTGRATTQE